jgi:hypothetical protein
MRAMRLPSTFHRTLLLLLCGMLLAVQVATAVHSADHPFHSHSETCHAFLLFDHSPSLPVAALAIAAVLFSLFFPAAIHAVPVARLQRLRSIRAPPVTALR